MLENLSSRQRKAPPLKPSEACLRLPPLLPGGDVALLAPVGVDRQDPGASAQICNLQVYRARQARQGLMSLVLINFRHVLKGSLQQRVHRVPWSAAVWCTMIDKCLWSAVVLA